MSNAARQAADATVNIVNKGSGKATEAIHQQVVNARREINEITSTVTQTTAEINQAVSNGTGVTAGTLEELAQKTGRTTNEIRSEVSKMAAAYRASGMDQSSAWQQAYRDAGLVKDSVKSTEKQVSSSGSKIKKSVKSIADSVRGNFKSIETQAESMKNKLSSAFTALKASAAIVVLKKLADIIKKCTDAYNGLAASQQGLESILTAQGRSVNQAKTWLEQYTKDGLISTADAYAAYKNLASAGYTDDQTQSIMQNLKDASAYNRQSSLSMGEAVKSAAEGIKNENSVLVDNAGVTKNLSVIWKEYAASVGKSADKLTAAEKRLATTQGLMRETAFQTGDAAKYANTLAGAMAALKAQTTSLSAAIGSAFAPMLKAVIPVITTAAARLTELFNMAAKFTTALFGSAGGGKTGVAKVAADAVKAGDNVDGLTAKVKQLKRQTAGFDQLNILSKDSSSDSDSSSESSVSDTFASGADSAKEEAGMLDKLTDKIKSLKNLVKKGFWDGFGDKSVFSSIRNEASGIKSAIKGIASDSKVISSVNGYLKSAAYNISRISGAAVSVGATVVDNLFGGLEKYLNQNQDFIKLRIISIFDVTAEIWDKIGQLSTAFADIFTVFRSGTAKQITADIIAIFSNGFLGAVDLAQRYVSDITDCITAPFIQNKELIKATLSELLTPIQTITGSISDFVKNTFNSIFLAYDTYIKPAFENIKSGLTTIAAAVISAFKTYFLPVFNNIASGFSKMMSEHVQPLINSLLGFCGRIIEAAARVWNYISPFLGWFISNFIAGLSAGINTIWNIASPIIGCIIDIISNLLDTLSGLIDFVTGIFTGDWSKAWNGIKLIVSSALDNVRALFEMFKGLVFGIINSLATNIAYSASQCFNGVKQVFTSAYASIVTAWSGAIGFFSGVLSGIKSVFGGIADWFGRKFTEAWAKVKAVFSTGGKIFSGMVSGIAETFRGIVNKIIGGINLAIAIPFTKINSMLRTLKKTNILGITPFGWVTEFKVPQIPQLAQGGIVNGPMTALIGEAGKEAVMPLENNTGWMDKLADMLLVRMGFQEDSLYRAFAKALSELPDEEVLLMLDSETVARSAERGKKKLNRRYGRVEV